MNRRRLRRCLAVSTIVGNMLMILITLSLAAILVAWAGTSFGAFSGGSGLFFVQRGQALQERFVVEVVFFNSTTHYIYIFVRNVGLIDVQIAAIYVNGSPTSPSCVKSYDCLGKSAAQAVNLDLPVQQVVEFDLSVSAWTTGQVFQIVVASLRGNQAVATARGP